MMRKAIAIFIYISLFFFSSLIINLIPINTLKNNIVNSASNRQITIDSENNFWYFRILGLKITTSNLSFKKKIDNIDLLGYGDNFAYNIVNGGIEFEKITFNIYIKDENDIKNTFIKIIDNLNSLYYSFDTKNLYINIYLLDKKSETSKKNSNVDDIIIVDKDEYKYKQINSILFRDVQFKKTENKIKYGGKISIDKKNELSLLFLVNGLNTDKYEVDLNIVNNNNDMYFYLHDRRQSGEISCSINNLKTLLENIGFNIDKDYYKNILNKKINLNGKILHSDFLSKFEGRIGLNEDFGNINYFYKSGVVSIDFNKLNLFSELQNKIDYDNKDIENKLTMSGQRKTITNNVINKNISIEDNSLNKISKLLAYFSYFLKLQIDLSFKELIINNVKSENVNLSVFKDKNSDIIDIKNFTGKIGNNVYQIKDNNGENGNILIYGDNIKDLCDFFGISIINSDNIKTSYYINGDIRFFINGLHLKDYSIYVNDKRILFLDYFFKHNYLTSYDQVNSNINIEDIEIQEYFNTSKIYSRLYNSFLLYQLNKKQDATIWKKLFEKHHQDKYNDDIKHTITINNSFYGGVKINNFAFVSFDNNRQYRVDISINSGFLSGKFNFKANNINDYENLDVNSNVDVIDLRSFNVIYNDFTKSNGIVIKKAFFDDIEYNIPSFIGINGDILINIGSIIFDDERAIENLKSDLKISNGVINSKNNISFEYLGGRIESILSFSLQNTPSINLGITATGMPIDSIINEKLHGLLSSQCIFKTYGFNPIKALSDASGQCKIIVQNLSISNFDLLGASQSLVENGVKNDVNYDKIIHSKNIIFSEGTGECVLSNQILSGNLKFGKELVSGSLEYDYDFVKNKIDKSFGSFAMILRKTNNDNPMIIYIPFACNGKPDVAECLVNWEQLNGIING